MSDKLSKYLNKDNEKESKYLAYALAAFLAVLLFKFLAEYMYAKLRRDAKRTNSLLEARRLTLAAQVRMHSGGNRGKPIITSSPPTPR